MSVFTTMSRPSKQIQFSIERRVLMFYISLFSYVLDHPDTHDWAIPFMTYESLREISNRLDKLSLDYCFSFIALPRQYFTLRKVHTSVSKGVNPSEHGIMLGAF